jgi:CheY-like chemotaxis protein
MLLEALARRNHFRTILCEDGRCALTHVRSADFDVILLDMLLPHVDGFEVLERLSVSAAHLLERIIVVTAVSRVRLDSCAQLPRVWQVVRKPFELQALEEQILACSASRHPH